MAAAAAAGVLYGSFAKTAGKAFSSSSLIRKFTGSLADIAPRQLQLQGSRVYAGIVFLILMTLAMAYVASALGRAREEEAEGYLDNLLVREVSRQRWLGGYTFMVIVVAFLAAMVSAAGFWLGAASQHAGLTLHELVLAGVNTAAPAIALIGLGVAAFGFAPRLTAVACWGVVAWAFLVDMLGSAVNVNHWIMDTSLLRHMALAPAVHPDWRIVGTYAAIGGLGVVAGLWRFTKRDLASG
jgi:ABC-2 type transport system permease protein